MRTAAGKVLALHLAGNALLLWLGYEWLGMGESTGVRLLFSALAALAILVSACWLHGATMVFYRTREWKVGAALRTALRHVPALLAAALLVFALYGLLAWAATASGQPAFRLASWLTLKLRTPVRPATVTSIFLSGFWIVRWVVLPVVLLPMAAGIAAHGWRGFGEFGRRGGWRYWMEVPLLLVAGLALPFLLLGWVPPVSGFGMEVASFAVRLLGAYLLFVLAVWTLERRTATSMPPARRSEPQADD